MSTRKNQKFRPYLTLNEMTAVIVAIETKIRNEILDKETEISLTSARRAIKKCLLSAECGIGIAYTSVSEEERKRSISYTAENLELSENSPIVIRDSDKLAAMSEYEQDKVFLDTNLSYEFITKEEYEIQLKELKEKYNITTP